MSAATFRTLAVTHPTGTLLSSGRTVTATQTNEHYPMAMRKQPTVTRTRGQKCLVCNERIAVGELGYTIQNIHVIGRVHAQCKARLVIHSRRNNP